MTTVIAFLLLSVLVLDLYLSAARSVLEKIHVSRQLQNFKEKLRQVDQVHSLLENYSRVDTGLQILQMISRFLVVGFSLFLISQGNLMTWEWWFYLSLLGGALVLAILEWVSSMSVVKDPGGWALRMSEGIWIINRIASPLVAFLFLFTRDLEEAQKRLDQVSEEELKSLVDESLKEGILEKEERKMIHSVFRLDDTLTREIMVPRIDILAMEATVPFSEAYRELR